jgi:penicillin-binding protein 2
MVVVRNPEHEVAMMRRRVFVATLFIFACFAVLAGRFVYLQVVRHADFHAQAEDNRIALVPIPPPRGLIYDRNGVLIADNVSAYTLEVRPDEVASLDGLIEQLASIVEITPRDKRRFKRLLEDSKTFESIPLKTRLTDEEVAKLAAHRFRFPAIEIRARQFRTYPLGEVGSHLLGYIGRISPEEKRKLEEAGKEAAYAGSTHIGKIGLEQSYEAMLHGQAGSQRVEVSAGGRIVRSLSKTPAVPGANLVLSVDIKLQKLTEEWFGERKGTLVAIEPATGDVLAFVSKPTYDPNQFVDGIDPQLWKELTDDPNKPLLNRPLRGTYPPGSTYKPFMALAVLESGTRSPGYTISDPGFFALGSHRFRDSRPSGNGSVNLHKSIVVSSDTYYYGAAYEMGVDTIHDFMKPWGFGQLTGIDLDNESTGILPSSAWKMKRYKQKWLPGETPSIGIGQGYNTFTMLQLAHATATLANNGVVMRPHLVKLTENPINRERTPTTPKPERTIALNPEYLALVKQAMIDVNRFGTSRVAMANTEYIAAGKTGTAQVIGIKQGEKYVASRIAERFRDHSLFMAFAPADNPKIALAVIVENGGFGAQAAAPIARKVFDYYLLGKLPKDTPAPLMRSEDEAAREDAMRDVPADMTPEPIAPAARSAPANPAPPIETRRP